MVIGNGLLASRFQSFQTDDRYLIFAAGVSNSRTRNESEFERESTLLSKCIDENPYKIAVYFSTYSIYDPDQADSVYVRHKLNMENLVRSKVSRYFIFRVSNLAGKPGNPNTILNYFYYHIKNQVNFDLWTNACRNILDIDDLFFIITYLFETRDGYAEPINIAHPRNYPVPEIVNKIESHLNVKANYVAIEKGSCFDIDLTEIAPILSQLKQVFEDRYLERMLLKYYVD